MVPLLVPARDPAPGPPAARPSRRARLLPAAVALLAGFAALPAAARAATGGAEAGVMPQPAAARAATVRTSSSAPASARRTLVGAVQRRLHVKADGVLGARTRAAVRRFQRRHHLPADGGLGAPTLAALGLAPASGSPAPTGADATVLAAIAECESGGEPTKVSADGRHRGKYQFLVSTWRAVGGTGDPAVAPEAEQDQRAAALYADQGADPWPVCGRRATASV